MTRALFIDAKARTVSEIDLPKDEVRQAAMIHALVGGYFETVPLFSNGDALFVNDDMRSLGESAGGFALMGRAGQAIAGNGVVVGTRPPFTVDAKCPLEALEVLVVFLQHEPMP